MAAGIHDYEWSTQIHTMVTAFSLNDVIEAEVKLSFNLDRLSDRTTTMIINNFKRGYKLREGYGKVNCMTNILCKTFNIPQLPLINKHQGYFFQENDDFKKWLIGMGIILKIPIIDDPPKNYNAKFHYCIKSDIDPISAKLMFQVVKKKYKQTWLTDSHDVRQEAIEALNQKRIISHFKEYKLDD